MDNPIAVLSLKPRRIAAVIAFATVLLAMYMFMSNHFQQSLLTAINEQNAQFVEQVNTLTSVFQNMLQSCATQIYHASAVKHVRTSAEHTNFEMIEAMREINKYEALYPFIDSIYLYNGKRGYVYLSSSNSSYYCSDYIHKFKDESAAALLMNLRPENKLIPLYRSNGGYSPYSQNNYVYSYIMFDVLNGQADDNALMLNIPATWLNSFLFGEDNPSQWIIGQNGTVLACPEWEAQITREQQSALNDVFSLTSHGQKNGYFISGKGRDRQLYFYACMGSTGWRYVRSMAYEDCMGTLLRVHRFVWTIFTFLLLLAGMIAIVLFVKVLFPYRQLVTGISQLDGVADHKGDTSKMLEQLTTLASHSRDVERLNASFLDMIREEAVRNILFGSQNQSFDANLLQQYGMTLNPEAPVFLMLVSSIRLGRYLDHVRIFTPHAGGAVISAEYAVLIIQADESLQEAISQNVAQAAPTRRVLYTPVCPSWNDIPAYYDNLLEAYHRRFLYDDMILPCSVVLSALDDDSEPLDACIQDILQMLRKGSYQEAFTLYKSFVIRLRQKQLQTVYVALTHLFTDVMQALLRANPAAVPDFTTRRKQFDALLSSPESMDEINTCFSNLFHELIEAGSVRQREKRSSLIAQVSSRIIEELSMPTLNSQSLSDHFSLSSAYLCRVFRQETGISLADYINNKRIERAQELLRQPELSVKEISQLTGFSTEKYFYVVFKKLTGITPKQYRNGEKPSLAEDSNALAAKQRMEE